MCWPPGCLWALEPATHDEFQTRDPKSFTLNDENSQNCLGLSAKYRTMPFRLQIHFIRFFLLVSSKGCLLTQQEKQNTAMLKSCDVMSRGVIYSITNLTYTKNIRTAQLLTGIIYTMESVCCNVDIRQTEIHRLFGKVRENERQNFTEILLRSCGLGRFKLVNLVTFPDVYCTT